MANKEQPTGYNFEIKGKLVKEHECPICLMLIRNAIELPCTHLMCGDCLIYYEENELERNENAEFRCSLCKKVYRINQKKEVRSTDRIIRQSLEVKCKNWKDGCDWLGSISDYENHHITVCEFLMVECPNNGCKKHMQRSAIQRHKDFCEYRIVSCGYCEGGFPICWLEDHHETCLSYPVLCRNPGCKEMIQRKQMDDHLKNECQYQVVLCPYSDVGCTVQLPRHGMDHHQNALQHHSFLLLKSHVELSKKNVDLEKQLKKSNENTEELQKSTIDLSNKNKDLEKQLKKSIETLKQLQPTVINQYESIGSQQAEIISLKDDLKKHKELEIKEKLTNLETFAKQSADFYVLVSDIGNFFSDSMPYTLNQKVYDDDKELRKYKTQLKEIKDKGTDCYYLQTLGKAVGLCHAKYMSEIYHERFLVAARNMIKYVFYGYGTYRLKIDAFPCKSISFKFYNNGLLFQKEVIMRKGKWNLHRYCFASYYDKTEECYYLALSSGDLKEAWLLHQSDEKQNKRLQINDKTLIEFEKYELLTSFILEMQIDQKREKASFLF